MLKKKHSKNSILCRAQSICAYIFLPFLLASCVTKEFPHSVKLSRYNNADSSTFIFTLDEEFESYYQDSKIDEDYPKMTKAEVKILKKTLLAQNFCLNKKGKLAFEVTSKQEKIYDITFSHLIEQNYKAKPVAPRTYFGRCLP